MIVIIDIVDAEDVGIECFVIRDASGLRCAHADEINYNDVVIRLQSGQYPSVHHAQR